MVHSGTDAWSVTAAIAASVAAVLAIPALVYTAKTFYKQKADAVAADLRHQTLIRPRPQVASVNPSNSGSMIVPVTYANPGGDAARWFAVHWIGGNVYQTKRALPAHFHQIPQATENIHWLAAANENPFSGLTTVVSVALDVESRWWDVPNSVLVDGEVDDHVRRVIRATFPDHYAERIILAVHLDD